MVDGNIISEFIDAIKTEPKETQDTLEAIVAKIDNEGIVWVNVAGSEIETPTANTSSEVKRGDNVNVEWRNNKLYIVGNSSNPSAGSQRVAAVEREARRASSAAEIANKAAADAVSDAEVAREAAADAKSTAESIKGIADEAKTSANEAKTQAEAATDAAATAGKAASVAQAAAEAAQGDIDEQKEWFWHDANGSHVLGETSGFRNDMDSSGMRIVDTSTEESVAEYTANSARIGKSNSQRVMILPNATQFYDNEGAMVGEISQGGTGLKYVDVYACYQGEKVPIFAEGITMSLPSTPENMFNGFFDVHYSDATADKDNSYEMHFTYSSEHPYESETLTDGDVTLSYDATAKTVTFKHAKAEENVSRLQAPLEGRTEIDFTSPKVAFNGSPIYVTFTPKSGGKVLACQFTGQSFGGLLIGSDLRITYYPKIYTPSLTNDMLFITYSGSEEYIVDVEYYGCDVYLTSGYVQYATVSDTPYFTFGKRNGSQAAYSLAVGYDVEASGDHSIAMGLESEALGRRAIALGYGASAKGVNSLAFGNWPIAEGDNSFASGYGARANADASHAQNTGTLANGHSQTAIGKYNKVDASKYAFIVGNGTSNTARSDALAVTWDGDIHMYLDENAASGTDYEIIKALKALDWYDDVIV